jgi:GH24 family phage-related lysozyme (muramidase)
MVIDSGESLTKANEGCILTARPDSKGFWEIGWGHDIPPSPGLTWTQEEADTQFNVDYPQAISRAIEDLGHTAYDAMNAQRQAVFHDIAYEIGGAGLAQFRNMIAAAQTGNWQLAASALKDSLLFSEVPVREGRNIRILQTGEWP